MHRTVAALVAALLVLASNASHAETSIDLMVGGAFTDFSAFGGTASGDDSIEGGLRVTTWFSGIEWLGISGGVSVFSPLQSSIVDLYIVPISIQMMGRIPLAKDETFVHGRFQPYAGIGPAVFASVASTRGQTADEYDVGLDLRLGVDMFVTPAVSVFGEYRFTYFKLSPLELETSHVQGGIAFHF